MKLNQKLIFKSLSFIMAMSFLCFTLTIHATAQANRTFTLAELASNNGHNGAPAYVVVNGFVYDLTSVPEWANGRHFCSGAIAGKDITFLWNLVPRSHKNPNFLKRFKVVGKLGAAKTEQPAQPDRTFTPQELAAGNGKNGAPAYVAVNSIVYDLTSVPEWARGRHYCPGAIAGKDITFLWNLVPRSHKNPNFLKRFKAAGQLVGAKDASQTATPTPDTNPVPSNNPAASLAKLLIMGLGIAVVITLGWLLFRMKR